MNPRSRQVNLSWTTRQSVHACFSPFLAEVPGQVHSVCATRYACRTGSGEPAVTSSAGTSGPGERLALLAEQRIRAAAGLGRPAEKRLGADDPTTTAAHSVHNLSHVLHDQGDLDHARTLHQRAVSIREARPGADHPTPLKALTTSPPSWPTRATSNAPAPSTSAPFASAKPAWALTTPTPCGAGNGLRPW